MGEHHLADLGSPSEDVSLLSISDHEPGPVADLDLMTRSQAWNLYISHFLSTWNMRMYEFAAIIFTAAAYPDTLLATSIRGIVRTLASICFSSLVGRWIDQSSNRLKTLTTTIVANRLSVMIACALWFFIVKSNDNPHEASLKLYERSPGATIKWMLFSIILIFGIFETLSASGNTLCMERDWVVVASSPIGKPYDLTELNSIMRRIDLICKLIAPIFISIIISTTNTQTGVMLVGGMSASSFLVEMWCAKRVWDRNAKVRAPKGGSQDQQHSELPTASSSPFSLWTKVSGSIQEYAQDFKYYFSSVVWIPSLALAFLHISALAYSATLITFLLNVGFSLDVITIARAAGSVVEISSTIVTPIGVNYLSKAKNHGRFPSRDRMVQESNTALLEVNPEENGTEIGIFRLGLWGISWQLINLVPVIFSLWFLSSSTIEMSTPGPRLLVSFTLFFFLSTSRLGLWIYDLTTQQLTQTMTSPHQRSSFAGVENSFVALFELMQNVIAIILHKPEQFKWLAGMSWIAVALSTVMYSGWVWKMRGHLVHWDMIVKGCECVKLRLGHERRILG